MKFRRYVVHVTALFLLVIYFGVTGYVGMLTGRSAGRRIMRYQYFESLLNPRGLENQISDYVRYRFPERDGLIRNIHSAFQAAQGKRESRNFRVMRDNAGYLHQGDYYQILNYGINYYAKRMQVLDRYDVAAGGGRLLVIGGADKYIQSQTPIYSGYPSNFINHNKMDEILLHLFGYGVDTLDLRQVFGSAGLEYGELFYRTGRGWSAKAAQAAALAVMDHAEEQTGIDLDPRGVFRNPANYREIDVPNFEGIYAAIAGTYFGGGDEHHIVELPRFDTSFSVYDSMRRAAVPIRTGTFEETLVNPERLGGETGGYFPDVDLTKFLSRVKNNLNPEGVKALFVGGNDFLSTAAYFSLVCGELVFVSTSLPQYGDSVLDLIEDEHFDWVLYGLEIDAIGEELFPFYTGQ